jgi:hypothetical protein
VGVDAATVTGGMFIDNGAQVKIDDPATITPTGSSSAQLKVGSLAATTWALFYATPNECDASRGAARAFV